MHLGCHNYSVPVHVQRHVDLIKPTVQFNHRIGANAKVKRFGGLGMPAAGNGPKKSNQLSKAAAITPNLANCDKMITLDCLRALYKINYTPVATDKNTFGVGEYLGGSCLVYIFYSPTSLQLNLPLKHSFPGIWTCFSSSQSCFSVKNSFLTLDV